MSEEIEVTPEMIAAGREAMSLFAYCPDWPDEAVVEIFEAMTRARRDHAAPALAAFVRAGR